MERRCAFACQRARTRAEVGETQRRQAAQNKKEVDQRWVVMCTVCHAQGVDRSARRGVTAGGMHFTAALGAHCRYSRPAPR